MGGSYRHITDEENHFIGIELIDNLGDAWEALRQCHAMIEYLTKADKRKIFEAYKEGYFKKYCPKENLCLITYDNFWNDE